MAKPVRVSHAVTKPVAKQARATIPVTARACDGFREIPAGRRFLDHPARL